MESVRTPKLILVRNVILFKKIQSPSFSILEFCFTFMILTTVPCILYLLCISHVLSTLFNLSSSPMR